MKKKYAQDFTFDNVNYRKQYKSFLECPPFRMA